MFNFEEMKNKIILADCMDIMKDIPDKYFELAIVDPPYGIGLNNFGNGRHKGAVLNYKIKGDWDKQTPDENYFNELFRISNNQIVWGANNYHLPINQAWIFWDKGMSNEMSFASGELAWTSFKNKTLKKYFQHWTGATMQNEISKRIHPTQKPIALYRWLLQNYAKPGDKIIDTHSGSGSLACACHLENFDFLAIEKDKDYYKSSCERLETLRSQGVLF